MKAAGRAAKVKVGKSVCVKEFHCASGKRCHLIEKKYCNKAAKIKLGTESANAINSCTNKSTQVPAFKAATGAKLKVSRQVRKRACRPK